ncbi:MAG: insulinase family protein, partial [Desulfosudaceae bacterium]
VYNEMKGAMSAPEQIMHRSLLRELYPDTTYSYNSGGDPAAIPGLTHAQLKAFHRRHYHPSNAFFYTYGNIPVTDHLAVINEKVLSQFEAIDPQTDVRPQPRWSQPRSATAAYPVAADEDPTRKHQFCLAWLAADIHNTFDVFTLVVLEQILLGNSASPLRKALMESGLGSSLSDGTGLEADLRDIMFACGLKDVGRDDGDAVENIILNTLAKLAEEGVDAELVESAIHQIEFQRREVSNTPYPYGVKLFLNLAGNWLHGTPPENILQIDPLIDRLYREMEAESFWGNRIRTFFLDNPHRLRFLLAPDPHLAEEQAGREIARLAEQKAALSTADIEKIKQDARDLEKLQMEPDDPEILPTLTLSDISPDISTAPESRAEEAVFCYPQSTSGIFYYTAAIGTGFLSAELLPLVPFFCFALTRMGTARRDYADLARQIDLHTGGIGLAAQVHTTFRQEAEALPFISFFGKCLDRKQDKMFELIEEILTRFDFSDTKRLHQLLVEYRAAFESSIVPGGHRYAISLASRNFSPACALAETWHGIHQFQFLKSLTANLDNSAVTAVAEKLSAMAGQLLRRGNFQTGLVGGDQPLRRAVDFSRRLQENLEKGAAEGFHAGNVTVEAARPAEGWSTATAVSFVAAAFQTVRLDHPDAPTLAVISKLLRSSFLHREIREKGGAYGGFAMYNTEDGRFCLASYRDPHIHETLSVYERALDFLQAGEYGEEDITESILQVCSDIDKPDTPAERGTQAFRRRLTGLSDERRRAFKKGVIAVTRTKVLTAAADHFPASSRAYATAVISSAKKLQQANEKIDPPLRLFTI